MVPKEKQVPNLQVPERNLQVQAWGSPQITGI